MTSKQHLAIVREFEGSPVPDRRLQKRLEQLAVAAQARPDSGFPKMFASEAELEAFYRFIGNDRVGWEAVIYPHLQATVERCALHETVVVAHDTTEFRFGGRANRDGLTRGRTGTKKAGSHARQGFWCHVSMAVGLGDRRAPLGVLAMHPWSRSAAIPTPSARRVAGATFAATRSLPSEQQRWGSLVERAERTLNAATSAIHVMDSEADDYRLLNQLIECSRRFVVRLCYDRVLVDDKMNRRDKKLRDFVADQVPVCTRSIKLSAKSYGDVKGKRRTASRRQRQATLAFTAATVSFKRPISMPRTLPKSVTVNLVRATEIDPAEGTEPVEWLLATTEPIDSASDVLKIADCYRARWRIEELFKAIKTGCAYEKRQLESLDTLLVALALFVPVAWQMLALRTRSRETPNAPASLCLTKRQIVVLRLAAKNLPEQPTVRGALLCIARLGGHLPRNGEPGWQTLGRGYAELLALERGYALTQQTSNCDQS